LKVAPRVLGLALGWGLLGACDGSEPVVPAPSCPANVISGRLEPLGLPGSIGIAVGPQHQLVTWSNGYHAAAVNGDLVVVSPTGQIVARVGDTVELSGVEVRPGEWLACGGPRTVSPS